VTSGSDETSARRGPRRLAIVVSTGAPSDDLSTALALARAARRRRVEVALFFMADAVAALPAHRPALAALADDGCELACCASSATAAGLGEADVGMLLGSQDDHARAVTLADRVVAFT
jgi:sulfur relay (sulfurtransferase) complex TusBCD TusD component (DsrE family)